MTSLRKKLVVGLVAAGATFGTAAAPSQAIVGGHDAAQGAYPSVAQISYGLFLCTGTLIAPNYVLTAGHCSSITGEATGSPATWPAALIQVTIGSYHDGDGEKASVSSVTAHPNYLATSGYDISLLKLTKNSAKAPTKVAGTADTAKWAPGTLETIAGWGVTSEGGSSPNTIQEAQVPITTDAACAAANSGFSAATMICAGFPQGGVDTCQGDSGGPMFGGTGTGRVVVGTTSFGTGCARPNQPGVYGRVGDTTLREWIRGKVPAGVN
jgi:secreted trypsin-like serine protease